MIFAAALIVILGWGNPPLPYRRGQVVTSDIKARVSFSVINEKSTKDAKEAAADTTPNVYRVERSQIDKSIASLRDALALIGSSQKYEDLDQTKAQALGVTPEFYTAIKGAPEGWTGDRILQAVAHAFDALIRDGSLSPGDLKIEDDRNAAGITILDGSEKHFRQLSDLVKQDELPSALRVKLRQEIESPLLAATLAERLKPIGIFLTHDQKESDVAKKAAYDNWPPVENSFLPGETMVPRDTVLDKGEIAVLEKEHQVYLNSISGRDRLLRLTGLAITILFLVWLFGAYTSRYQPRILARRARMGVLMALAVALVVVTRFFIRSPALSWYMIPLSLFGMAVAVAYDPLFAIGYSLFLAILVGIATSSNFALSISLFLGTVVGVLVIGRARSRTMPFLAGLAAGCGTFVAAWGTGLLLHADYALTLRDSFYGLLNGVAAGVLITVILPYVERAFNVITELSLLELVDLNKPILRRLALEAPGTYNHSLFVGNLADAAAEVIGANQLMARAGGYYHDIGKLAKSGYFVENIGTNASRHYNLSPTMSALVIISHVKDAVELARQYKLPPPVVDIIKEHHGTTLVEYFYREAMEQAAQSGEQRKVNDESFRYPGPKPHSKEAAIVMLCDCVESASRTITDPTPGKLENLVHDIARNKLADGQFDECNLTMAELRLIEVSLIKSLAGIFHSRIKYPGREL